jgi:rhodanese-related sulfurtransferase
MPRKAQNIFEQLQIFEEEFERLENKMFELEEKMKRWNDVHRSHLIRVKNGEQLSDEFIQQGKTYLDVSPEKAWKLYQDPDYSFLIVDVSSKDYQPSHSIPEAVHMPWEQFAEMSLSLHNTTSPIFIISEDGTKSILACELLVKRGFYNCCNISGGHQYWKGRLAKVEESA